MDIEKTGAFIKTLRAEKGLTQKELAEKLGCTDKAVSRWETGKGLPDAAILLPLSEQLGVSVNELLRGERFITASKEVDGTEDEKPTIDELLSKTDETLVGVIEEKETQIKKLSKATVLLLALCCWQAAVLYAVPTIVGAINPTWEAIEFVLYATIANCVLVGLMNRQIKWFFPFFIEFIMLCPAWFTDNYDTITGVITLYFFFGSAIIIGLCSLAKLLIKKVRKALHRRAVCPHAAE